MAKSYKARLKADNGRLEQLLELKDQQVGPRMANSDAVQLILKELVPWDKRARGNTYGKDFWVGLNANEYVTKAREIADDIIDRGTDKRERRVLAKELMDNYGYGPEQARQEIADLFNVGLNPNQDLAAIRVGVPNAAADEGLAKAAMIASGIKTDAWNRGDPITSTDFMAAIGSGPLKGVDAQRRFRNDGGLTLGIFQRMKGRSAKEAALEIARNSDRKLGSVIEEINTADILEDKFMQTRAYNKNPSKKLADEQGFQNYRKDYLISADMSEYVPNKIDEELFKKNSGSYNPSPGKDYSMIDLNMMRDELLDTKIGELLGATGRGYSIEGMKGALKMIVPKRELIRFSQNDLLDREIINEITKRRNK